MESPRKRRTRPLTPGVEEYAKNGFKFPMVEALKEHLASITQEQFDAEWAEIEKLGLDGPSFDKEEHKQITGFDTPAEYSAYCLGRHDEEMTIVEWIRKWDGSTNSQLGQILFSKMKEVKDKL